MPAFMYISILTQFKSSSFLRTYQCQIIAHNQICKHETLIGVVILSLACENLQVMPFTNVSNNEYSSYCFNFKSSIICHKDFGPCVKSFEESNLLAFSSVMSRSWYRYLQSFGVQYHTADVLAMQTYKVLTLSHFIHPIPQIFRFNGRKGYV